MAGESAELMRMTNKELAQYDGKGTSGRLFVAVNGKIYDINEKGKQFYMPGGPYEMFAGRDASRALALMSWTAVSEDYDPLNDLDPGQRQSLAKWEQQFSGKYPVVGELKKP